MTPSAFKAMGTELMNYVADPTGGTSTWGFASTGDGRWGRFDNIYAGSVRGGLNIGRPSDLVCFFEGTPTGRLDAYTQTYSTAGRTVAAVAATAVATTAATQTTPFGFSTGAQADDIITQLNALRLDMIEVKKNLNSVIDDLQAFNLVA